MPTLTQQETIIRAAAYKGFYYISNLDPSVTDDRNKSFLFGSRWLNTATQEEFVCLNNSAGAAVWISTTSGSSAGIAPHITTTDPTSGDDTLDGYVAGQLWLNTALAKCFIAMSVVAASAVWIELTGGSGSGVGIHTSTSAPGINDDITAGKDVGDLWIRTTNNAVYICVDSTDGAAIWVHLNGTATAATVSAVPAANNAGTNVQAQLDNINNAIANVFYMGRLLSLAVLPATLATVVFQPSTRFIATPHIATSTLATTVFNVPSPAFIPNFNTVSL